MLRQVCALLALAAAALAPGAAAAGCDTRPTLRLYAGYDSRGQGDLKPDVKVVQSKLGIPDDGFYGPNTEARVIDYQDEMGLTQDGVVGPNTWAALCGDSEPSDPSGEPNCGSLDNPHSGAPKESPGTCTSGVEPTCWSPSGNFVREKIDDCFPGKFSSSTYKTAADSSSTHAANAIDAFPGASDVCVTGQDKADGDALAAWVRENAGPLNILYVIWQDRIWSPARASEGWRKQGKNGCKIAHFDHVHISVK